MIDAGWLGVGQHGLPLARLEDGASRQRNEATGRKDDSVKNLDRQDLSVGRDSLVWVGRIRTYFQHKEQQQGAKQDKASREYLHG